VEIDRDGFSGGCPSNVLLIQTDEGTCWRE
jgi:hypothetical protein